MPDTQNINQKMNEVSYLDCARYDMLQTRGFFLIHAFHSSDVIASLPQRGEVDAVTGSRLMLPKKCIGPTRRYNCRITEFCTACLMREFLDPGAIKLWGNTVYTALA